MNSPRHPCTSGCGVVGLRAHLLPACYAGEKTSSKRHANRMMFVWLPVSSGWHCDDDTVLMHRYIQGDSLYIPERFGVEGELYVEVTRTWCFMAKDLNWPHHHGQQVWCRRKLLTGFHLQGLRMILTDCEVCCVKSVGGCHYSVRIGNISKWWSQSKWPT